MDSLPLGLLVIDHTGRVQAVNRLIERTIGVSNKEIRGKTIGEALGCITALKRPQECISKNNCKFCKVWNLCTTAINNNQAKRARTSLQIINDNQPKNVDLLIRAVPFSFGNKLFSYLVIEDIPISSNRKPKTIKKEFRGIIGQHPSMKKLFKIIKQVAQTDASIMIQGETGTGKELVAEAIHKESKRAEKYFVPINCGALPEGLLETELFGHVRGAFTGAIRDKKGRFELANGGTFFLDEVGELSPYMQIKLLRVLQDGKFNPIGSEKTLQVDVRVISATNKDLEREVKDDQFRKDLYYRLNAIPIFLPPLRERRSDIPILAEHFLAQYGNELFGKKVKLSPETISMMYNFKWHGNVRELQNAIQFALSNCQKQTIDPIHLPQAIRFANHKPFIVRSRKTGLRASEVIEALKKTDGNKMKAAKVLGVSRSTLYRFFDKHKNDLSNGRP